MLNTKDYDDLGFIYQYQRRDWSKWEDSILYIL